MYRDGQISTLEICLKSLRDFLLGALTQGKFFGSIRDAQPLDSTNEPIVLTVENAFWWLQNAQPHESKVAIEMIGAELEVATQPSIDWRELIEGEWDFALWCLWIYIVVADFRFGIDKDTESKKHETTMPGSVVKNWMETTLW
jgi:hypothetical protein